MNQNEFFESLSKFGIGGISDRIPENLRSHLDAPPEFGSLIQIQMIEQFPLQEPYRKQYPPSDEMRRSFVEAQLKQIRDLSDITEDSLPMPEIPGPVIEIEGDFESEEEFINFKKAVAVDYKRKSESLGFRDPINVCKSPICINPAIPGFEYCTYHIIEDEECDKQIFLKQCEYVDEKGNQCKTPCASQYAHCLTHRNQPIFKRRRSGFA
ncbi:hypothetical protein TRFO_17444 [Tritrichomonas foetus]|uniref:KANL2-like probable zinc-finger domain-containing protein n=1 Tax=Tritrichomonas foetus TaxID=1144522 RepID=A0A1J4KNA3_9EUKA|nr:hypothetical protein TRFO_17444 [Tritrichomonas foetus]|eukprot:OHT12715.1 hypothetical protein TRFO_17444 [Tritrichomonas foetus]